MVEHDRATGFQMNLARKRRLDLMFDLVTRKQRDLIFVELELADVLRHDLLHELQSALVNILVIDEDLADVATQIIADRADDKTALLIDQEGRRLVLACAGDGIP